MKKLLLTAGFVLFSLISLPSFASYTGHIAGALIKASYDNGSIVTVGVYGCCQEPGGPGASNDWYSLTNMGSGNYAGITTPCTFKKVQDNRCSTNNLKSSGYKRVYSLRDLTTSTYIAVRSKYSLGYLNYLLRKEKHSS